MWKQSSREKDTQKTGKSNHLIHTHTITDESAEKKKRRHRKFDHGEPKRKKRRKRGVLLFPRFL